ncbi:MAG TPA: TonB-dependent receptor [Rhizomicrobium sp.]|jgi:outer membrane receptor protein involved in Fe transport
MARRITKVLLGSISLAALVRPALAEGSLETVVVTAEKRSEEVKNVPIAITVLGQQKLERNEATDFEDYVNSVPGMNYTAAEPGHTQLILRGINAGGDGSTIGTYVDETPFGSSNALANGVNTTPNLDTFDIQRIEVLRGPQGTLYGSSTLGGLLKFVTNAPNPEKVEGAAEVGGSDYDNGGDGWSVKGMLNVPLASNVALRVVGYHDTSGGYIDDPGRDVQNINYVHDTGGRAALQFNLTNDFNIRLSAIVQDLNTGNDSAVDLTLVGLHYFPKYGEYEQQRVFGDPGFAHFRIYNGTLNYDFGWASLMSSTSYGTFRDDIFQDGTGAIGLGINGRVSQNKFTQEVRLASPTGSGPLDWLVGLYYTNETAILHQDLVLAPHGAPLGFLELDSQYAETAGFADLTYHFTDRFDVSVGGRYSHNDQTANQFGLALANGASDGNIFTWSVAPSFHLDDDTVLYGRIAKGYRPGGPNVLPIGGSKGFPAFYGPDSLINYEAGVKTDLFDGRVSLDADLFLIDWSDIQLLIVGGNPPTSGNGNGGNARSQGFEWNIGWNPIDPLTINFNGAYTDAHLTQDTDPLTVGALKGAQLPWSPHWNLSLDGDYDFDPLGDFTPFVGASWRYVGARKSDFDVGQVPNQFPIAPYNTVDMRLGVRWDAWEAELYGKNLNNAEGLTAFSPTGISAASGNSATGAVIAPREFGVTLRVKF